MQEEVFISYKSKDPRIAQLIGDLQAILQEPPYSLRVITDIEHVGVMDDIPRFMNEMGRARFIIVILTPEYLRAEFCMFELAAMSLSGQMKKRVFPIVLEGTRIQGAKNWLEHSLFWKNKLSELREQVSLLDKEEVHESMLAELHKLQTIVKETQNALRSISGVHHLKIPNNKPPGPDEIAKHVAAWVQKRKKQRVRNLFPEAMPLRHFRLPVLALALLLAFPVFAGMFSQPVRLLVYGGLLCIHFTILAFIIYRNVPGNKLNKTAGWMSELSPENPSRIGRGAALKRILWLLILLPLLPGLTLLRGNSDGISTVIEVPEARFSVCVSDYVHEDQFEIVIGEVLRERLNENLKDAPLHKIVKSGKIIVDEETSNIVSQTGRHDFVIWGSVNAVTRDSINLSSRFNCYKTGQPKAVSVIDSISDLANYTDRVLPLGEKMRLEFQQRLGKEINCTVCLALGLFHYYQDQLDSAAVYFTKAEQYCSSVADDSPKGLFYAEFFLANTHFKSGRPETAAPLFEDALQLMPHDREACQNLAICLYLTQDWEGLSSFIAKRSSLLSSGFMQMEYLLKLQENIHSKMIASNDPPAESRKDSLQHGPTLPEEEAETLPQRPLQWKDRGMHFVMKGEPFEIGYACRDYSYSISPNCRLLALTTMLNYEVDIYDLNRVSKVKVINRYPKRIQNIRFTSDDEIEVDGTCYLISNGGTGKCAIAEEDTTLLFDENSATLKVLTQGAKIPISDAGAVSLGTCEDPRLENMSRKSAGVNSPFRYASGSQVCIPGKCEILTAAWADLLAKSPKPWSKVSTPEAICYVNPVSPKGVLGCRGVITGKTYFFDLGTQQWINIIPNVGDYQTPFISGDQGMCSYAVREGRSIFMEIVSVPGGQSLFRQEYPEKYRGYERSTLMMTAVSPNLKYLLSVDDQFKVMLWPLSSRANEY